MSSHRRPVIGVTGPDRGGLAAWYATAVAVWWAGGRPRRVTPKRALRDHELDGLIIGGGADVSPDLYGETAQEAPGEAVTRSSRRWSRRLATALLFPVFYLLRRLLSLGRVFSSGYTLTGDTNRDDLESRLIAQADERKVPMLGICRGAQLINVQRGGRLHQDLKDFYVETPRLTTVLPYKPITIDSDSRLADVLQRTRCRVNSLHRQAISETGEGIQIVGREESGVVQAIEDSNRPFMIGVQWHPEYLPQRPEQRRIFKRLVECARENAGEN
ncbi:MAG TPA: type 1 glutamine amidotransferase [Gammaproteobacteria bacterium]|nr:type 1 glutamine amidotransferase [Gammaproteobacteria bacterium]